MLFALLVAATRTRAATDAEIREYSQTTVARLRSDPKCRSVYGPPSNNTVATSYDAFPVIKNPRSKENCRCGTQDGAPALPRVQPSKLGGACHLVFALPCAQTRGWSCDAVDEVWVTSIPKVGSQSVQDTYQALRLNHTVRGWQPPRGPCLDDAGKRVRRIAFVRDPWTKFVSAVREVQFATAAKVLWGPWRQSAGCATALPRDRRDVAAHAAAASEFAKNAARGFGNLRAAGVGAARVPACVSSPAA
jgi:hypothetical protein